MSPLRARVWLLIALLLGGAALARPKKAVRAKRTRAPATLPSEGPGQVTFTTATTAYLNRGTVDGVAVGSGLVVTRGGRLVGRCTVSAASEKWSICNVQGLQVGDRVAVVRALPKPPAAPPTPADPAELEARRQKLEAEEVPLVDFAGASGGLLGRGTRLASIAVSHTTWLNLASPEGPYHTQRIDLGAYDIPIWRGIHGSADLTVLNFSQRPAGFQSPLRGSPVVLVRQLELSYHSPQLPLTARLGRTWTRYTPGLLMVDGAQAGWRNRDESVQVGAYGGMLPDPVSLGVSSRRWTVGGFVMARLESGKGPRASLLQLEAHAGYAVRALVPGRLEIGVAVHARLTPSFDAHQQVELGALSAQALGLVDGARLDFGWRPAEVLRVYAAGRYRGTSASDTLEVGATLPGQRALHADLGVTLELSPGLWIGALAGTAIDFTSRLNQTRFGPELTFPQLFGQAGSLTVSYQEEIGWLRGRTAWLQATVIPVNRLRILARGSWFQEQRVTGNEGLASHELGASLVVDLTINRWMWIRISGMGRGLVGVPTYTGGEPISGTFLGQLGGQL